LTHARRRVADGGFVVGGALMLVSAFVPWVRRGAGSTLHGHALIDTIAAVGHQHGYGTATTLLAIAWYAIPACGALAWVVVGFDVHGATGRAVAAIACVITAVVDVFFATKVGTRAGSGVYAAALGAVTLAVSAVVPQKAEKSAFSGTTGG
jgi:hypothetical protein